MEVKILCLGDVVGARALAALQAKLPALLRQLGVDFTIINGENAHLGAGNGLTAEEAELLFAAGADVITGGNHSFRQRSLYPLLEERAALLRPLNYPDAAPGHGDAVIQSAGVRYLVLNAAGRAFMEMPAEEPLQAIEKALRRQEGKYDLAILDFHAEATSEKFAVASYFDGRISLVVGTHTHVQTADEQRLPAGTVFLTDLGMCGPRASCLGVDPRCIAEKMRTGLPQKFLPAETPLLLQGLLVRFRQEPAGFRPADFQRISLPL